MLFAQADLATWIQQNQWVVLLLAFAWPFIAKWLNLPIPVINPNPAPAPGPAPIVIGPSPSPTPAPVVVGPDHPVIQQIVTTLLPILIQQILPMILPLLVPQVKAALKAEESRV